MERRARTHGWQRTRAESIYDPRPEDEAAEEVREEPDEAEPEPEPDGLAATRRYMTVRERAVARLGSQDCIICEGDACWCGVAERLSDLTCGHAGGGICRWYLASSSSSASAGRSPGLTGRRVASWPRTDCGDGGARGARHDDLGPAAVGGRAA
jgi:hypothetical protein